MQSPMPMTPAAQQHSTWGLGRGGGSRLLRQAVVGGGPEVLEDAVQSPQHGSILAVPAVVQGRGRQPQHGRPEGLGVPQALQHHVEEAVVEAQVVAQPPHQASAQQVVQVPPPGQAPQVVLAALGGLAPGLAAARLLLGGSRRGGHLRSQPVGDCAGRRVPAGGSGALAWCRSARCASMLAVTGGCQDARSCPLHVCDDAAWAHACTCSACMEGWQRTTWLDLLECMRAAVWALSGSLVEGWGAS